MSDLFEAASLSDAAPKPLAERLRPDRLGDVVGQDHLLEAKAPIGRMVAQSRISSMILWGPPGTGKTTIAQLLANLGGHHFEQLSAVFSGVADLRRVFDGAKARRQDGQGTVLFVDEIHRFNKSQQDGFLPFMENGTVILIGATTENPSFELNASLLSRAQVLVLKRLDDDGIEILFQRAEDVVGAKLPLDHAARSALAAMADGDGRYALNLAEELFAVGGGTPLDTKQLAQAIQRRAPHYDKAAEGHYNLVSALHKSVRGSDVDAALYWLARMLAGGEDPLFLSRRVVRMAVEDIGLADPNALVQAIAAKDAFDFLGSPEGELAIAQAVIYLATAPKSNSVYRAFGQATKDAAETGSLAPPAHALNAPTKMMKDLGYGKGYQYDHDAKGGFAGGNYFPDDMDRQTYYQPTDRGLEKQITERLAAWARVRNQSDTP